MKKVIVSALSLSFAAQPVLSEQMVKPGTCELIVAARPKLSEARAYVRREISNTQFTKIFKAQNGWYAISIGALKPDEEKPVMTKWKSSGRIPHDSYCSTGKKYTALYDWRTGNRVDGTRSASNTSKSSGRNLSDEEATAVAVGIIGAAVGILGGVAGAVAKSGSSNGSSYDENAHCYSDDTCFSVLSQSGNSVKIQCTKGSRRGEERCVKHNQDGMWSDGCGFSDIGGYHYSSLRKVGNYSCDW